MRSNKLVKLMLRIVTLVVWFVLSKTSLNRKIARHGHHIAKVTDKEKWSLICRVMGINRVEATATQLIGGLAFLLIVILYSIIVILQIRSRKQILAASKTPVKTVQSCMDVLCTLLTPLEVSNLHNSSVMHMRSAHISNYSSYFNMDNYKTTTVKSMLTKINKRLKFVKIFRE